MKYLLILFLFINSISYSQLTMDSVKVIAKKYELSSYSYHEQFIGHKDYAAPIILTSAGGAAIFGDGDVKNVKWAQLVKIDKNGKEVWKKSFKPQFDELESQSVIQDENGNFYIFMLSFDYKIYRGGCQRVIYLNKDGITLWDKILGKCDVMNNPIFSYIHLGKDGKIELRGHVVKDKPVEGKDPVYKFWEGWLNDKGIMTEKVGEVIDWSNKDWQKKFNPEE